MSPINFFSIASYIIRSTKILKGKDKICVGELRWRRVSVVERVASYFGFSLVVIAVVLFWLLDWMLGSVFTVFAFIVMVWYLKMKRSGDAYLREVSERTKCNFKGGGFGYGSVYGDYKGRKIEVTVNKTLDADRSLAGFIISYAVLESAVGVVAGIKNFTAVKVEHRARIEEPFQIDDRTCVDKNLILYLPESNEATGLPWKSARSLVAKINKLIKKAEEIETNIRTL